MRFSSRRRIRSGTGRIIAVILAGLLAGACSGVPVRQDDSGVEQKSNKSPAGAAALSLLFPGAGHLYLNEWSTGTGLMCLGGAELTALAATALDGWPKQGLDVDPTLLLASIWYQNTWTYGVYAAYRDARLQLGDQGYRYPVPTDDLTDLLLAPFDPDVIFQPEVGLGLVGMIALGMLASYLVDGRLASDRTLVGAERVNFMGRAMHPAAGISLGELYYMGMFLPVGIGEEALFRGVLQSGLSEHMGQWGGLASSSLIFGAAHAPNAYMMSDKGQQMRYMSIGVPFLTLLGGYMGWVYMHNGFSLAEPVALHFWYDFIMSTLSFVLDPDNQPFAIRFSLPF